MASFVLDASAVLALLNKEPGGDVVRTSLREATISAVNLAEVGTKLSDQGASQSDIRDALRFLELSVEPFDEDAAIASTELRPMTRHRGLSLGDRVCLALAARHEIPVLTADRNWSTLDLGVDIRLIRE